MNSFFGVLQGSYAYLLIFQIVVVTGLLLVLLWLIARRIREVGQPETVPAVPDATLSALSKAQSEKILGLETQIQELEKGGAGLVQLKEKNKALSDKVQYLEQKLLEYEILQEEISTLSVLKLENEKLKGQLGGVLAAPRPESPAPSPSRAATSSPAPTEASGAGLKPFDDNSDKKSVDGTMAQEEIDGLIAKIDSLSTVNKR